MTKKAHLQTERLSNPTHVLTTTEGQIHAAKENVKEIKATAPEIKQTHQTYIYKSFGGGYQGL